LQEDNIHDFELEDREDQFMNTLNYVMGLADFKLLTQKKAENLYEKYLLNIDISVDKEKLDYKFIERYHRQFPNTNRAEITDYFLIFQRGTGIDEAKKFFYTEKVEVLVRRLKKVIKVKVSSLFPPKFMEWIDMQKKKAKSYSSIKLPKELLSRGLFVATVLFYVWGLFSTLSDPHRSKGIFSAFFGWLNFFLLNGAILGVVAFIFLYNPPFGTEQKDKKKEKKFAKTLRVRKKSTVNSLVDTDEDQFAKKIKRIRLDQLPLYPKDLLVQTTLQEPTFRDVIIIYREIGQKAIRLKRFVDIPLADLELVYPAKAISLNLTDSLIFFVTIIVGLVSVANSSYGENLGDYVYSIALGVGILIARSIYNYNNQKSAYEATLTKTLYEKQVSTDETLLIHLVRNCEEQEVKEALLAFFMLTKEGSQKEDILDYLIEAFLRKYFKKNIDFHVSNALSKLSHIGLVEISPGGLVTAIPLEKAVSTITKKWSEFDIGLKDKSKEGGMVSGAADFVTGWIPGMGKKKSSKTPQKEENSSIKN
ncbi:uncharacterized protein LOC135145572, partial [Zophobas morio]|uniref:uncharacterized protein LOC135145572 n=1 Tax=Zophobas morio TaxID=2755281 RepID=UPI003082C597